MTVKPVAANGIRTATLNTYDDDGLRTVVRQGTATSATPTAFTPLMRTNFIFDAVGIALPMSPLDWTISDSVSPAGPIVRDSINDATQKVGRFFGQ